MKAKLLVAVAVFLPVLSLHAKPSWIDGQDPNYDDHTYLKGVGYGTTRSSAESNALAALSKIFVAKIESASKDYQASFTGGKKALEVQSVETLTKVGTEKILSGVKIAERYDDKGTIYALAILERIPAAETLKEKIEKLDRKLAKRMKKVEAETDKLKKLKSLRKAARYIQERMTLNEELRIVSPKGKGIPAPYSAGDILAQMEGLSEEINIGVEVKGSNSSDLKEALIEGLTKAGFQVTAIGSDDDDDDDDDDDEDEDDDGSASFDLVVRAKSRMEKASVGGSLEFARVVIDVELYNPNKQKVVKSFSESRKEGHRSIQEAARRAVRKMKSILVKKIQKSINKYLGKKS